MKLNTTSSFFQKKFSSVFIFFVTFITIDCGLKPVPPPEGKFCDTWHKPVECVDLDFRKGVADLGQGVLPMAMKSVVNYRIIAEHNQTVLVEVLHEHRVKITFPGAEPRLYLKIRDKEDRKRRWEKAKEEWNDFFK